MSNYRRLISYIYAYEGGIKGKNVGFAKLEVRNGQCKLQVNVRNVYIGSQDTGIYLLSGAEEILVGKIFIRNGAGEFRAILSVNNIAGSGHTIDQCYGLTVHNIADSWQSYTTIWEDAVAHAAEVALSEATSEKIDKSAGGRLPEAGGVEAEPEYAAGRGKTSIAEAIEAEIEAQSRMEEYMKEKQSCEGSIQEKPVQERTVQDRPAQERRTQERAGQEARGERGDRGLKTGQETEGVPPSEIVLLESLPQFLRPSDMEAMEVKPIKLIDPISGRTETEKESDPEKSVSEDMVSEAAEEDLGEPDAGDCPGEIPRLQVLRDETDRTLDQPSGQPVQLPQPPSQPQPQLQTQRQTQPRSESRSEQLTPVQPAGRSSGAVQGEQKQTESGQAELRQAEFRPRQTQPFRQNWWSPVFSGQGRLNRAQTSALVQSAAEPGEERQAEGVESAGQEQPGGQRQPSGQEESGGWSQSSGQDRSAGRWQPFGQPQPSGQGPQGQGRPSGQELPQGQGRPFGQELPQGQSRPFGQELPQGQSRLSSQGPPQGQGQPSGQEPPQSRNQPVSQEPPQSQSQPSGQEPQTGRDQPAGQMGQLDPGKLEDEPKIDVIWQHFYKSYPKIQAFDYKGGCDILTIKPQDIGLLPREVWGYGNNSFLLHGYYSHRYLIFARLNSQKGEPRFLLGVPGHYYSNEKYMASMFGFPNFVLSKIQPAGDGRFGYWYTDIRLG